METSHIVFPLKSLPAEIQKFIYPHNNTLALPHDSKTIPALLLALTANEELFEEALEMYKPINVVVTKQNIEQFKGMRMKDLLKFQCFKIICNMNESNQYSKDYSTTTTANPLVQYLQVISIKLRKAFG
jgi:hypothetical protein